MVSLPVWLIGIEILACKSSNAYQGQQKKTKPLRKNVSKIGVDFGILGGVDLVWLSGTGKKGLKNPRQSPEQNPRRFSRKSVPEL